MDPRGPAADEIRLVADRSRAAIATLREELRSADERRRKDVGVIGERANELIERLATQVASEIAADMVREQSTELDATRQQVEQQLADLQQQRAEYETERQAWQTEREEWEAVRVKIEAELSAIEERLVAESQKLKAERAKTDSSSELLTQLQEAVDAQHAAEQQLAEAQQQVNQLSTALDKSTQSLAKLSELETDHATLLEKFEMALADLQSHREHVAELEQEIANRPVETADGSVELASLRQERDQLAEQLEEARSYSGGDASVEVEDLRSRFQMAVEDLRELKTENAELRDRLANSASAPVAAGDGNDWEAQKRRLLASLESEGEPDDEPRREERAKIAGTIQITDAVVAEKDAEIERLHARLEASAEVERADDDTEAISAVLDSDELIRAERERLAKLEDEWREKLRSAELELSVERAKITRAQSELAEQQLELETLRASGEAATPGEARRNWFNKLGLGNEGDGDR
ncbi:hypothetical protein Pla108_11070 [Botrimarina colliarenosi]|uniref:Uncharacterized protein n=2 Tax=Botrimarina colliarenosi TaxID=2528001 RepID=A0A5C6AMD4_9BACT|nr:hypothetical protein Pla108_11070 [Botrimarina colliarenosi]